MSNTPADYAACYCEENILRLLKHTTAGTDTCAAARWFAVVVSNPRRTVAIWQQRRGDPVVWDYHVVALRVRADTRACDVFDLDTALGRDPIPLDVYLAESFPPFCAAADRQTEETAGTLRPAASSSVSASATASSSSSTAPGAGSSSRDDLPDAAVLEPFAPRFRIVPSSTYIARLATDRSHMIVGGPGLAAGCDWERQRDASRNNNNNNNKNNNSYQEPLPPWPAPSSEIDDDNPMNLARFVGMDDLSDPTADAPELGWVLDGIGHFRAWLLHLHELDVGTSK
jgi:hypothetical protein